MASPTTILMLSANPRGTVPLRLDEERREIEAGLLERSRLRDQFQIITKTAVRPRDFQRAMLDHNPQVVHFSGHGVGEKGLALEDETGKVKLVNADALASLFALYADSLHCVVLNACYAEVQATAIVQHIPYAIGMSEQIRDRAAIEFAVAFYDALGAGKDVEFAYKNACVAIQFADIAQAHIPILHRKAEPDAIPPQASPPPSPYPHLPTSPISPITPSEPMTSSKRQRLEAKQADLQKAWNRQMELLTQLRQALVIEAGVSTKFQLEKQVQTAEAELAQLEAKLDAIEQDLNAAKK